MASVMRVEVLLIGVKADVVNNVLSAVMVGVGIGVLVVVVVTSVLTPLELAKPSSYAVDVLAGDWDEAFIGIDFSIDMRVDELIDVLARVWVDVMTALNFSMPASSEERLRFC